MKENPNTVEPPADTTKPLAAASPPPAPAAVVPSTANWNPAISVSTLNHTSPSLSDIVFTGISLGSANKKLNKNKIEKILVNIFL